MPIPRISGFLRSLTSCVLAASLLGAQSIPAAQPHVVSAEEMQAAIVAASQTRQKNRETIVSALGARVDVKLVKTAVSSLSDEELARLAARVNQAEADFAAGRLSDRDLLWVLVGIAALILIIVAVR